MGCTSGCVKCILNTINTFWAIGGVLLIAFGAVSIGKGPSLLIYLFFIIGGINLIAAILGCCGICQEHICMTTAYAAFIGISLVVQICAVIFANNIEGVKKYATDDVNKLWDMEIKEPGTMNFTQAVYHCCGKSGPSDYIELHRPYPDSCYGHITNLNHAITYMNSTEKTLFEDGCLVTMEKVYVATVGGLVKGSWGSAIFTVIMLIFAIYLIMRFRRKQRHYNY